MKSLRVVCKAVLSTLVGAALIFFAVYVRADTTLELKNDFIEKFKNRATIDATYTPKLQDELGAAELMTGVWRIWPEHGGESLHVQGAADANDITDTKPDHIFEVHPLTKVGSFDVSSAFHPIPGFRTKDAQSAFQNYEGARSKIIPSRDTTRIRVSQATFNYVEFKLELLEDPSHELDDGLTAFGRVRTLDGEIIVQKRRMV